MFAMGMAALGALLGFWIAVSASPVVMTALPLFFGVAGGFGGLSLAKLDLSKPENQKKMQLIGISLAALCASCLMSTLVTLAYLPTLRQFSLGPRIVVDVSSHSDPAQAVALRAKLSALGATPAEQDAILFRELANPDFSAIVKGFHKAAKAYVAAYESFSSEQRMALETDDIVNKMLLESYEGSKAVIAEIEALGSLYDGQTIARLLLLRIDSLTYFDGSSSSDSIEKILRSNPRYVAARAEMYANIIPIKAGSLKEADLANQTNIDSAVQLLGAKIKISADGDFFDAAIFPNGKIIAKVDNPVPDSSLN